MKADANRKHIYKTRRQSFYLVCALTFLPCQFHSLFLRLVQKTILTYTGEELENKRIQL